MSKCLCFDHAILNTMAHGIQSGHASVKLVRKYMLDADGGKYDLVADWADNSPTIAVLVGGLTQDLNQIKQLVRNTTNLPWAEFREPDYGNMVTSIAVLVPDDWHVVPGRKGYKFFQLAKNSRLAK